jgi:hypothetical protein
MKTEKNERCMRIRQRILMAGQYFGSPKYSHIVIWVGNRYKLLRRQVGTTRYILGLKLIRWVEY